MNFRSCRIILGLPILMLFEVHAIVTLVSRILDLGYNEAIWMFSGIYGPLFDGYIWAILLNGLWMLLMLSYAVRVSSILCFQEESRLKSLFHWIFAGSFAVLLGGHYYRLALIQSYISEDIANVNYHMLKYFLGHVGNANSVHLVETRFKCCGINGPSDYNNVVTLPDSCCILGDESLLARKEWFMPMPHNAQDWDRCKRKEPKYHHNEGCLHPVEQWMTTSAEFLIGYNKISMAAMLLTLFLVTDVPYTLLTLGKSNL